MGRDQLGGRRDGKSREYTFRRDGKQLGREQDAVSRDGRRWEQRPRSGRGREVAVGNETQPGFPFPSPPVPDPTITARTLGKLPAESMRRMANGIYVGYNSMHVYIPVRSKPSRKSPLR